MALLLTEFAGAMQGIAYSTVLPVMARDLDGFALFGATLAAGSVAAVLMLSFTAPILQRVPPLRVLVVATALYVVGAALAVFAPTMGWVLAGTVVRGIAAGCSPVSASARSEPCSTSTNGRGCSGCTR